MWDVVQKFSHVGRVWRSTWSRHILSYLAFAVGVFICHWYENVHLVIQGMSQEKQIIINMIFAILKVVCILYVRFGTVLSHVVLQLLWLFAGVVALLAGKRFLAGVWKHVILQTTGATGREAALLTYKWLFCSVGELVALENTSSSAWIVALVTPERLLPWMRQHVFLEVRYCCAGEFTLCAAERFFSRMKAGVFWGCQLLCSNNYTLFS